MKDNDTRSRRRFLETWLAGGALAYSPVALTATPSPRNPYVQPALVRETERHGQGQTAEEKSASPRAFFSAMDFGALGDGKTKDTQAIQRAIAAAAQAGGGTVHFPAGLYLSGTLTLRSHVTLHLEPGATLLGSKDPDDYPPITARLRSYTDNYVCQSLIYGEDLQDVSIIGRGSIDGQGAAFALKYKGAYRRRPYTIRFVTCQNVLIEGITLRNSPMWMQHYLACDNLVIRGITVYNRGCDNNDMMDVDSCRHVRISECVGTSDDDAITLKSTTGRACEDVTISNCMVSTSSNGIKFGSETNGGFKNIAIANCTIKPPEWGMAGIALEIVDGGALEGVTISNIAMARVSAAILLRLGDRGRRYREDMERPAVGTFRDVNISNVVVTESGNIGCSISGIPGHPIENVSLSDIRISVAGGGTIEDAARPVPEEPGAYPEMPIMRGPLSAYGFHCRHVNGLTFNNVELRWATPDLRPALLCDDVRNLELNGFKAFGATGGYPLIVLDGVREAMLRGCSALADINVFLRLQGASDMVSVISNDLTRAATAFELAPAIPLAALYQAANRLNPRQEPR